MSQLSRRLFLILPALALPFVRGFVPARSIPYASKYAEYLRCRPNA